MRPYGKWIILAYLGLADRIASRYRHGHRTTLEDLTQTARAGLIAAVDRYDPAKSPSFVPFAVACVVGELKRYLRDTSWRLHVPGRAKKPCCGCTGRPMSYARPWAARPPPASWPTTCT
jgi:RNA polymerase sigma-B factor